MDATFPPDVQQFVSEQVAAGRYSSETDLVVSAVRRLRSDELQLQQFKAQLRERIKSTGQGEAIVLDSDEELGEFLDQIDREVDAERMSAQRAAS